MFGVYVLFGFTSIGKMLYSFLKFVERARPFPKRISCPV